MQGSRSWCERLAVSRDLPDLVERLHILQAAEGAPVRADGQRVTYAFRGLARDYPHLLPTLVHECRARHDRRGLAKERRLVEQFRQRAWRFLDWHERAYLGISAADTAREDPAVGGLRWDQPSIWSAIAIARHYSVPTRLIDWTQSSLIAAYFAASQWPKQDGIVWWYSQSALEDALRADGERLWQEVWRVPSRDDWPQERALHRRAFSLAATPWVSKVHHEVPFHRLKVQQGFFTASGRLDEPHDALIDALQAGRIPRGRVQVPSVLKRPLLDHLERMGINAKAIDFPGADTCGWKARDRELVRRGHQR